MELCGIQEICGKNMVVYLYQEAAMYPLSPATIVNLTVGHFLHPLQQHWMNAARGWKTQHQKVKRRGQKAKMVRKDSVFYMRVN